MPTCSEQLARFIVETRHEDLPAEVTRDVRLRLLDALGLALASSTQPFAGQVLDLAREWYGAGPCTALGLCGGLSAPAAGLVNGTLVHGQDYDDTHTETLIHATSTIGPAAFALAEERRLSGRDLVVLAALGYEVNIRTGLVACPGAMMHERGFHTTALGGAVAAAAMGARALGLGAPGVRDALGLSTSVASGLLESTRDGSFAKGIQPGWAVQSGLWAARAAAAGITGPREGFEGRLGFFAAHMGLEKARLGELTEGLGERWEFLNTDYKLFPVCHHLQAHVESALSMRQEAGVRAADEVVALHAELGQGQAIMVCEPRAARLTPSSPYAIKFSLPYSVAMALAYGSLEPEDFERALADPAVRALASRFDYALMDAPDFPSRLPGKLVVETRDGRILERAFTSTPGRYGRPVADEEIERKFRSNACRVIGAGATEEVIGLMRGVERLPSLEFLSAMLGGR